MTMRALAFAVLAFASSAFAAEPVSPLLIEQAPYTLADQSYDEFVIEAQERFPGPLDGAAFRRDHPIEDWRLLRGRSAIEAYSMAYQFDGLRITGAIVRPRRGRRHPILIWARGGVGEAELDPPQMVEMVWWAQRGYVVVASNFRGAGGSDGVDEFGGADVGDLTALVPIAQSLEGVDAGAIYAIGFSRGGLMLYRAAAEGMPIRAFATAGGPTDLASFAAARAEMTDLFERLMPDYSAERANNYCRRSAVCWSDRIHVPVLIVHGGQDRVVPPDQAWALARALERQGGAYHLTVFSGADHGLNGHKRELFEAAHAFFSSAP